MTDRPQEPLRPGLLLAGRYRLERIAGSGGMAIVWRARDERLGRAVAIKVMSDALAADPSYVARFAREAQLAARIHHPNLVDVFEYAVAAQPYLVMEYVNGGTLAERLRGGPLAPVAALALARDLLSALSAVHRAGVLHRDVKPGNVLLGGDGRARLTDFGVARLEDATQLTLPGHLVGTLRYLAPELAAGTAPSPQSDLYALGVLLREAAGPDTTGELEQMIAWLSASEPAERPGSAAAALAELERSSAPPSAPAGAPTSGTFTVHRAWRWPAIAAAAFLLLTVIVVAAILALGTGGSRTHTATASSQHAAGNAPRSLNLQQRLTELRREIPRAGG